MSDKAHPPCPCGDNDGNWCSLKSCPYKRDMSHTFEDMFVKGREPKLPLRKPKLTPIGSSPIEWIASWGYRGCTAFERGGEVSIVIGMSGQPLADSEIITVLPVVLSLDAALEMRRRLDTAITRAKMERSA